MYSDAGGQSGSGTAAMGAEQAALTARAVAEALSVLATPAELGAVDDRRLTRVLGAIGPVVVMPDGPLDTSLGGSPVRCVIDGSSLDRQPVEAVRDGGPGADVDLLVGTDREEASLCTVPSGRGPTEARPLALAERRLADPREGLTAYRTAQPADRPAELASRLITDTFTRAADSAPTPTPATAWNCRPSSTAPHAPPCLAPHRPPSGPADRVHP
ncbi:hypothetical protein [Streptomyces sp. NPDC050548]|uniref:hypothetical protein n=1 Tax=Streptomyces sp. NPDC050548 TaxID=3365629 RepID=UPI0037898444